VKFRSKGVSRCGVPVLACDKQDEQGTKHNTSAVVSEMRMKRTKQSLIAQAEKIQKSI